METKGNDPIFQFCDAYGKVVNHGLSKCEYFAAMAMQGLIAAHEDVWSDEDRAIVSETAVVLADALIKALNEKKGE